MNTNFHSDSIAKKRLLWRCRQGTRELEILLYRFIENHYDTLSNQELRSLEELLECSVDDLNNWLLAGITTYDKSFSPVIRKIRNPSPIT